MGESAGEACIARTTMRDNFHKKGTPKKGALFFGYDKRLGEVVAHSGEDHVVVGLGSAADTRPCVAGEIAVSALVLQTAVPGAVVDAVGEADGALGDDPGC